MAEKLRTRTNIAANSLKTTAPPSARGAPMGVGAGLWCGWRDGCCGAATVADDEARADGARGKGRPVAQGCRPNGVGQSLMTVGDKKTRLQMACGICKRDDNRICGGLGYARASFGEAQDSGERSGRGLSPDDAAIDIEHLGSHVVALKSGYIFHTAGYALVAPGSSHEHLADGMGHGSVVVGV